MAAENPVQSLQEEATCPICLEYLTEPVIPECGHNFCQACISQCWEGSDTDISCPQCKQTVQQGSLRPNRQLANMIEIAKRLSLQAAKGRGADGVCGEHQKALKLVPRAHCTHTAVPIQDAAQEYKVQSCCHILWVITLASLYLVGRQKIVSEFQQLRQFLEEQERLLLAQLEKLDEEMVRIQNENLSKLSEEISRISELISELEETCQKPVSEFLQVRQGETEVPIPWVLKDVTLDPDTAHPNLVLSEDWKSVRQRDIRQQLPNNPERFDSWGCVLGCEGFTSGRHCWEMERGYRGYWAVYVARESVRRKGWISHSPEDGICAVGYELDQFWALTSPVTPLPLSRVPSRIRVCLDCDQGQVTFIDAGDKAPIFTFPLGSVPGERIRPWFWVGMGSRLSLCP
uniref:Zinc finger protein RFP-like n=1 Tax=Gopherus evgoodei TaxID=1825980 RepID=A0A8C4Y4K5_9SAUR